MKNALLKTLTTLIACLSPFWASAQEEMGLDERINEWFTPIS